MGSRILPILILLLAVLLLISTSCFVVREQELALRVQLSRIVSSDYTPGLHFKIPFVEDVVKFDRRVLTRQLQQRKVPDPREPGPQHRLLHQVAHPRCVAATSSPPAATRRTPARLVGDKIQDGIKNALARRTLKRDRHLRSPGSHRRVHGRGGQVDGGHRASNSSTCACSASTCRKKWPPASTRA